MSCLMYVATKQQRAHQATKCFCCNEPLRFRELKVEMRRNHTVRVNCHLKCILNPDMRKELPEKWRGRSSAVLQSEDVRFEAEVFEDDLQTFLEEQLVGLTLPFCPFSPKEKKKNRRARISLAEFLATMGDDSSGSKAKLESPDFEDATCAICLESFDDDAFVKEDDRRPRRLPCGHWFHTDCINKWTSMKNQCPLDREIIASFF
jgi:Ring finger domain